MEHILVRMLIFSLVVTPLWLFQHEEGQWDITRIMMKESVNSATHDAAMALDSAELSRGRLVFNRAQAEANLLESLQINLGLYPSMLPKSGTRVRERVTVEYFEILDESNSTFPMLYQNATYGLAKYLNGPAIVAVISTPHPKIFSWSSLHPKIQVAAIHEYRENGI